MKQSNMKKNENLLKNIFVTTGSVPSDVKEHTIIEAFSINFKDLVNPDLIDLRIWKQENEFYLFSSFSAPGNFVNKTDMIGVENIGYILGNLEEKEHCATFKDVEFLICNRFDIESIALSGLGGCYLLKPEIESYIQSHGSSDGLLLTD